MDMRGVMKLLLLTLSVSNTWARSTTPTGPYKVTSKTYSYSAMDKSNQHIDVVYPVTGNSPQSFPLISYAHGFSDEAYASYPDMFDELVSWGYVVVAPLACQIGCFGSCQSHLLDPPCYQNYYKQQLLAIDWARANLNATSASPVDFSVGVGVAGHSMGGQAAQFSAAYNSSTHDIRAAVMLHAYTHQYPAIPIPFLVSTGTADVVAQASTANDIFNAEGASPTRGIVNKKGANHHEPSTDYNPVLGRAAVAWFKMYLDKTPVYNNVDFEAFLYGNGADSLCGGGDGALKECSILRP